MLELSAVDDAIVSSLREFGVLVDVDGHKIDQANGVVLVTCGDGDHAHDIFTYHVDMMGECKYPRIHVCAWNGGALRLVPNSDINNAFPGADLVFMNEVAEACQLKQINTVCFYCHVSCGKAASVRMHAQKVVEHHILAKQRVRAAIANVTPVCFVHVCRNGKRNSYFLERNQWSSWMENQWPDIKRRFSLS